jgi:hypothetical protein
MEAVKSLPMGLAAVQPKRLVLVEPETILSWDTLPDVAFCKAKSTTPKVAMVVASSPELSIGAAQAKKGAAMMIDAAVMSFFKTVLQDVIFNSRFKVDSNKTIGCCVG